MFEVTAPRGWSTAPTAVEICRVSESPSRCNANPARAFAGGGVVLEGRADWGKGVVRGAERMEDITMLRMW